MIDCDGFYVYTPKRYDKDDVVVKEEIDKILLAGCDAILFIKSKTSFSYNKMKYTSKILKKFREYLSYNENNSQSFGQLVRWINNTFVDLDIHKFSIKQKSFVFAINNLLRKMREDVRSLYFFICGVEYGPTETGFAW